MINITCDKFSELVWIKSVVDSGVLNLSKEWIEHLRNQGINLSQTVNFEKSKDFDVDIPYTDLAITTKMEEK